MNNVISFITAVSPLEKATATGQMIIDGGLLNVDDAFMQLLEDIDSASDYLDDIDIVDPYVLLEAMGGVYESLGRSPQSSEAWLMLRDLCDFMEIAEECKGE